MQLNLKVKKMISSKLMTAVTDTKNVLYTMLQMKKREYLIEFHLEKFKTKEIDQMNQFHTVHYAKKKVSVMIYNGI